MTGQAGDRDETRERVLGGMACGALQAKGMKVDADRPVDGRLTRASLRPPFCAQSRKPGLSQGFSTGHSCPQTRVLPISPCSHYSPRTPRIRTAPVSPCTATYSTPPTRGSLVRWTANSIHPAGSKLYDGPGSESTGTISIEPCVPPAIASRTRCCAFAGSMAMSNARVERPRDGRLSRPYSPRNRSDQNETEHLSVEITPKDN